MTAAKTRKKRARKGTSKRSRKRSRRKRQAAVKVKPFDLGAAMAALSLQDLQNLGIVGYDAVEMKEPDAK